MLIRNANAWKMVRQTDRMLPPQFTQREKSIQNYRYLCIVQKNKPNYERTAWRLKVILSIQHKVLFSYQELSFFSYMSTKLKQSTAKRKLERLQFSTSSSFDKIWSLSSCEFKAYFWTFWALHYLLFDLETIGS